MKKRTVYILASAIIVALLAGLIGWAVYVGEERQRLNEGDTGSFDAPGGSSGTPQGGLFGGFFGGAQEDDEAAAETGSSTSTPARRSVLRQLYNLPVAGAALIDDEVVFVDRATGHVFRKQLPDGEARRVEQTTVPHVYRAFITDGGEGVIRQYVGENGDVVTVYNEIGESAVVNFPLNIIDLAVSENGDRVAYINRTTSGMNVVVATPDNTTARVVFASALRGWHVTWAGDSALLLTQRAGSGLSGSAMRVDLAGGEVETVTPSQRALEATPSPDGSAIVYSTVRNNTPELFVHDRSTDATNALDVSGFARSCTWDTASNEPALICALPDSYPDAQYPDDWYQGQVRLATSFWQIDPETGAARQVLEATAPAGTRLDAQRLSVNASGTTILFTNATDQTLWSITRGLADDDESE